MSLTDKERKEAIKESLLECFGFIPDNIDLNECDRLIKEGEKNGYDFEVQMRLIKSIAIFKSDVVNR